MVKKAFIFDKYLFLKIIFLLNALNLLVNISYMDCTLYNANFRSAICPAIYLLFHPVYVFINLSRN